MKIVKILLICLLIRDDVVSLRLNCDFRLNSEECKVNSLKVLENDVAVTTVVGTHAFRKTNNDVKELWISREVETERVPTKICEFFQNMERMDIYGTSINRISRDVFRGCVKVTKACVLFTSITTLPDDVFEDLIELKELYLYENKLVALPPNLIVKNPKLTSLSAKSNRLGIIDTELTPFESLKIIDFRANACIDKRFPDDYTNLTLFLKEVNENCESSMKKTFILKTRDLNERLKEKENEVEKLKSQNAMIESEKATMAFNITQLTLGMGNLRDANDDLRREMEAVHENKSQEIANAFNENISLRVNISYCQSQIVEKVIEARKFSRKNEEYEAKLNASNREIGSLRGNLTITAETIGRIQLTMELLEADKINLNESLEECWQNISTITEINDKIILQGRNLGTNTEKCVYPAPIVDSFRDNCADCGQKINFIYFIALAILFAMVLVWTVVFMRRKAARTLIKEMVNQQVSMRHLIDD